MTVRPPILVVLVGISLGTGGSAASPAPRIPLREGLTIVTALNDLNGDYESIKTFIKMDAAEVQLKYSAEVPVSGEGDNPLAAFLGGSAQPKRPKADGPEVRHVKATRTVSRQDLLSAHEYRHIFGDRRPEQYPGSTAVGLSTEVLRELKTKGRTDLTMPASGLMGALGGMLGEMMGGGLANAQAKELDDATLLRGTLSRVGTGTDPFKVLVNDQPAELPAVHARGRLGDQEAEFWILDDPDNPLSLKWEVGKMKLQVIKLAFPLADPAAANTDAAAAPSSTAGRMERDLKDAGRTVIYGIYFDFASDRIKEESEGVLKEIAAVMTNNPAWSLTVEGHTDSIGTATANQDLSERRAAAVCQALGERYGLDVKRLVPAGFGKSRPQDTNDTLEGRARNRRVELARINK